MKQGWSAILPARALGAAALLGTVTAVTVFRNAPSWVPLAYLICGPVSGVLYGFDKRAARRGEWRISERTLHAVDFAFGIIGGLMAQEWFRHKTSKPSFAFVTAGIALIHAFGLIALAIG